MNEARLISTSDYRSTPAQEYRFFLYDPEDGGMMFFKSAEIRDQIAAANIAQYCDGDGWSEEVGCVCGGEVTSLATKTDVRTKPGRGEFESDEDFEDAMDEWPSNDFDEICSYELRPVASAQAPALLEALHKAADVLRLYSVGKEGAAAIAGERAARAAIATSSREGM
jgi:hypothetical protein